MEQQKAYIEHRVNQLCCLVVSVHQRPGAAVDLTFNNCPAQVILKLSQDIVFRGGRLGAWDGAIEVASTCTRQSS